MFQLGRWIFVLCLCASFSARAFEIVGIQQVPSKDQVFAGQNVRVTITVDDMNGVTGAELRFEDTKRVIKHSASDLVGKTFIFELGNFAAGTEVKYGVWINGKDGAYAWWKDYEIFAVKAAPQAQPQRTSAIRDLRNALQRLESAPAADADDFYMRIVTPAIAALQDAYQVLAHTSEVQLVGENMLADIAPALVSLSDNKINLAPKKYDTLEQAPLILVTVKGSHRLKVAFDTIDVLKASFDASKRLSQRVVILAIHLDSRDDIQHEFEGHTIINFWSKPSFTGTRTANFLENAIPNLVERNRVNMRELIRIIETLK